MPGASVTAWTDALADCRDAGELAALVHHVGYADVGALARLHQFLLEAAERARHIPQAEHVVAALDAQADALDQLGGWLDDIVTDLADQAFDTPPPDLEDARTQAAQSLSPGIEQPGPHTPCGDAARPAPAAAPAPQRRGPH
ncbi:hypothetical protein [Streptacidiphilus fuscans]|uniref:Uncharacterized protein n=1 Tax=Streptacidiphilus fuscans TaxID=2789292 RepID=A0A931BE55_9ACTN|nr:hypothetical protein [Streptacidiphilus fuscans]MBF9071790.1 hypothetical protein [Streptacidiphilus fuscans]